MFLICSQFYHYSIKLKKYWTRETSMIDKVKVTFWPSTVLYAQKSNSYLNWLQPVTSIVAQNFLKPIYYHRSQVFMEWLIQCWKLNFLLKKMVVLTKITFRKQYFRKHVWNIVYILKQRLLWHVVLENSIWSYFKIIYINTIT